MGWWSWLVVWAVLVVLLQSTFVLGSTQWCRPLDLRALPFSSLPPVTGSSSNLSKTALRSLTHSRVNLKPECTWRQLDSVIPSLPHRLSHGVVRAIGFEQPCHSFHGHRALHSRMASCGGRRGGPDCSVGGSEKRRVPCSNACRIPARGNISRRKRSCSSWRRRSFNCPCCASVCSGQWTSVSYTGSSASVLVVDFLESVARQLCLPTAFETPSFAFDPDQPFGVPQPGPLLAQVRDWLVSGAVTSADGYLLHSPTQRQQILEQQLVAKPGPSDCHPCSALHQPISASLSVQQNLPRALAKSLGTPPRTVAYMPSGLLQSPAGIAELELEKDQTVPSIPPPILLQGRLWFRLRPLQSFLAR